MFPLKETFLLLLFTRDLFFTIFMGFFLKISSSVLKIYPVLLFSLLEDVSEEAFCRRTAK